MNGFTDILRAVAELGFADLIAGEQFRGRFAARVLSALLHPGTVENAWILSPSLKEQGAPSDVFQPRVVRCAMDMQLAMSYDLTKPFINDWQKGLVRNFIFDGMQHA